MGRCTCSRASTRAWCVSRASPQRRRCLGSSKATLFRWWLSLTGDSESRAILRRVFEHRAPKVIAFVDRDMEGGETEREHRHRAAGGGRERRDRVWLIRGRSVGKRRCVAVLRRRLRSSPRDRASRHGDGQEIPSARGKASGYRRLARKVRSRLSEPVAEERV